MSNEALEKENKRLVEEIKAITRNFETLCLKLKEDKNLIKRLENELSLSKSKQNKDEMQNEIQNYKEKYEKLASSINSIENKYHNASQNCKKYQENELKYKAYIFKLENAVKSKSKLEVQNYQLKKQNDQQAQMFSEENKKNENLNKKLSQEIDELNKKLQIANNQIQQDKKENEIIYKLLNEAREKLKQNENEANSLKEMLKKEGDDKYKKLYNDTMKLYEDLREDNKQKIIEIAKQKEQKRNFKNLTSNSFSFFLFSMKTNDEMIKLKNSLNNIFSHLDIKMSSFHDLIISKLSKNEEKANHLINDTLTKLSFGNSFANSSEISELKQQIVKNQLEISNLSSQIKKQEAKIAKSHTKKQSLKEEIKKITNQFLSLSQKQKEMIDLSEIKKLFTHIDEIIQRLKLTMETFSLNLKCKNCILIKSKLYQLSCGHSLCDECLKEEYKCIECGKEIEKEEAQPNIFSNNIITRYKYAQQQIESDIELVISTLKENFK